MNKLNFSALIGVVVALSLLGGCASTSQPALDQANNGAALMLSLQAEIAKFNAVQTAILKDRVASIKDQQSVMATYEIDFNFDEKLLLLAEKKDVVDLYKALTDLSDGRIKDEQALNTKLAEISAALDKLLTPLPDVSKDLTEAQTALAVLGEQLSVKERIAIVTDFAKTLDKAIKDNKQKIRDAQNLTPTAPVQEPKPAGA
ncbi:hypothetical protein [Candidatus Nitrotoga arctica]|uniref:Lipoprotein n=1 Tax=Candidatus Nitrotoga arctica TaxID=453162 RepID=A0ABM8YYU8_9PROT|nr:hypothetical protein [Candidatus Nitrotoga arctica]CAG9932717.1 conserved exported protein of unknown function [Candidatus Nitrotoga arctica]